MTFYVASGYRNRERHFFQVSIVNQNVNMKIVQLVWVMLKLGMQAINEELTFWQVT